MFMMKKVEIFDSSICYSKVFADQSQKMLLLVHLACNLQDVLEIELTNGPISIPGIDNLFTLNINPEETAGIYCEKRLAPIEINYPIPSWPP